MRSVGKLSLQAKRQDRQADATRLGKLWEEGKASGDPVPVDFDKLREDARQQLSATLKNAR